MMNGTMETPKDQSIPYAPVNPAPRVPLSERVNFRMLIFAGVVMFLLGWPIYTFVSESVTHGVHKRSGFAEVNLKALGQFEFDPKGGTIADVPPDYRKLDGQKVRLEGEIYDPEEAGNISRWQLVFSIQKCCFNGPPRVQERVFCTAPAGKSFKRGDGYHRVLGTMHVTMKQTKMPDGSLGQVEEVYHLDVESVEQI